MKRHLLLVYWLMLLISTLMIGAVAFWLLSKERERVLQLASDSARARGKTITDNLDVLVDKVKSGVMNDLGKFADPILEPQMLAWKDNSEYVHTVFIFRPGRGLVVPMVPAEQEELLPWLKAKDGDWIWGTAVTAVAVQPSGKSLLPPPTATLATKPNGPGSASNIPSAPFTGSPAKSLAPGSSTSPGAPKTEIHVTTGGSNYVQMKVDRANLSKNGAGTVVVSNHAGGFNNSATLNSNTISVITSSSLNVNTPQAAVTEVQSMSIQVTPVEPTQVASAPPASKDGRAGMGLNAADADSGNFKVAFAQGADGRGKSRIVAPTMESGGTLNTTAGGTLVQNGSAPQGQGQMQMTLTNSNGGGTQTVSQVTWNAAASSSAMLPSTARLQVSDEHIQNIIELSQTAGPASMEPSWLITGTARAPRWLGWMKAESGGTVRGVELSWENLLVKIRNTFPSSLESGEGFVLRAPGGEAVYGVFASNRLGSSRRGVTENSTDLSLASVKPMAKLSIGPEMPGWTVDVYLDRAANFSASFTMVSTVLVAILVGSVLLGGTLLLWQARREALDAGRKTSFVSNVSHELKTPLTTIRMYAELLGDGRVRDETKRNNYLNTIINESQRLTRLVNNVLDFNRLEQGRKKYNLVDQALGPLVVSVLEAQRPRLEEAGLKLETRWPTGEEIYVHADRDAIEQVLLNLLDNALKYAAKGHWLTVSVEAIGRQAVIKVADRGPGVPAEQQGKIFEMFHRVDDSLTAKQPGSGLGLSIARRLLRDQDGDLKYEPNVPQGACFVATLPLAPSPASPTAAHLNLDTPNPMAKQTETATANLTTTSSKR